MDMETCSEKVAGFGEREAAVGEATQSGKRHATEEKGREERQREEGWRRVYGERPPAG